MGLRYPIDTWIDLMTCKGAFPLSRVEIGFRLDATKFWRNKTFTDSASQLAYCKDHLCTDRMIEDMTLPFVFQSREQLLQMVRATKVVEFGPIFPPGCFTRTERKMVRRDRPDELFAPLKFDLDVKDYGDRWCKCSPVCDRCWIKLVRPALLELWRIMSKRFGFEAILATFSGNKGFHLYVLDRDVWEFTNAQRCVIYDYLMRDSRVEMLVDADVTRVVHHLTKLPLQPHPKTLLFTEPWRTIEDAAKWLPSSATKNWNPEWEQWTQDVLIKIK